MSTRPWTPGPWGLTHIDASHAGRTHAESLANARLIALAPEMAEAILGFADAIEELKTTAPGTGRFFEFQMRVQEMADRLRHIEGG